jgi:hypothetical protein
VVNGWIPACAGMTEVWQGEGCWEWLDSRLRGNDRKGCQRGDEEDLIQFSWNIEKDQIKHG